MRREAFARGERAEATELRRVTLGICRKQVAIFGGDEIPFRISPRSTEFAISLRRAHHGEIRDYIHAVQRNAVSRIRRSPQAPTQR